MNKFDSAFNQIAHFNIHPYLLPFVGDLYEKYRILFIAESHYVEPAAASKITDIKDWYSEVYTEKLNLDEQKWIHTRNVVLNNVGEKHRYGRKFILDKALLVLIDWLSSSGVAVDGLKDARQFVGYLNYFQRPSFSKGKKIDNTDIDNVKSKEIVRTVIDILKPKVIIFLSKKAFWQFERECENNGEYKYIAVAHPSCYWWKRKQKDGLCGEDRLKAFFATFQ
jgi:hypothetical protein